MTLNQNIIKCPKLLSIPPPPPALPEFNDEIKTVQRISTLNKTFKNNKDANMKKIRDNIIINKTLGAQEDNRKYSVGSGVSCAPSASTATEGERNSDRPQDVGSDHVSIASNDDSSASKDKHNFFAKLLVTNQLAGMLIGTSGQEIRALKEKTGAKVILSPHGKYFPGTSERLVVLEGTQDTVFEAIDWIVKLTEVPLNETAEATKPVCRICVPRVVVGSLIGKNGSYIQYVRMTTGAHVHVSPLFVSADEACAERVVTIQSREINSLRMATFTVLKKINEHPSNTTCRNISYIKKSEYCLNIGNSDTSSVVSTNTINLAQPQISSQNIKNNFFNECFQSAVSSEIWNSASYLQTYSSLQQHKDSGENAETNSSTLFHNISSSTLQSQPLPVAPLMLGPPPGLSSCKPRLSPTVQRNGYENVHQSNVIKMITDDMARVYNREVSAETESTQSSLNVNNGGINVIAALNDAEVNNNKVEMQSKKLDVTCQKRKIKKNNDDSKNNLDGNFHHLVSDTEGETGYANYWLRTTTKLSSIFIGWGLTIIIALIYYVATMFSAAAK